MGTKRPRYRLTAEDIRRGRKEAYVIAAQNCPEEVPQEAWNRFAWGVEEEILVLAPRANSVVGNLAVEQLYEPEVKLAPVIQLFTNIDK